MTMRNLALAALVVAGLGATPAFAQDQPTQPSPNQMPNMMGMQGMMNMMGMMSQMSQMMALCNAMMANAMQGPTPSPQPHTMPPRPAQPG
jgi:hypothetical protein